MFGYPIISAPFLTIEVQARTHKKSRINKKWRKKYGMKKAPSKEIIIANEKIYAHPHTINRLKRRFEKDGKLIKQY